jgi:hypothetical protein
MVPSMNTPYLTLAEASAKTGRSLSTVRRLIHSISKDQHHPERDAVIPSHEEAEALKKKGENFTWRIRQDIVDREFGSAPSKKEKVQSELSVDVLAMLQKELDMKNQQIEKQWEVIGSLNERLREGNILMASLQKRLALPEPASMETSTVEASKVESSAEPSKKSSKVNAEKGTAQKAAKEAEKNVKKKMFSWLWQPIEIGKKK